MTKPDAEQRFLAKITATEGCWWWHAAKIGSYGLFWDEGAKILAHRWAYTFYIGPIPPGMHIDHLCSNRGCVNPYHLEPVTPRENLMRGRNLVAKRARATHCNRGHEFTPENTYVQLAGGRVCRTCRRTWEAAHRARVRATKGNT